MIDKSSAPGVEALFLGAEPKTTTKFSAAWAPSGAGIDIVLDRTQLERAGTYDLYLFVPVTSTQEHRAKLRLKCQLVHVAPKLGQVPRLVITRIHGLCNWTKTFPKLTLQEATGKSDLTIIEIEQIGQPMVGNLVNNGYVKFPTATIPTTVPAGHTRGITYDIGGGFPLGDATRKRSGGREGT